MRNWEPTWQLASHSQLLFPHRCLWPELSRYVLVGQKGGEHQATEVGNMELLSHCVRLRLLLMAPPDRVPDRKAAVKEERGP